LKGYSARSKFPSNAHARRRNFIDKALLKMDGRRKAAMNSPSADRHKSLHFKSSPSPLAWKDAYRQKCIQRLRTGREKLVDRFRNINVQLNQDDDDGDESMDMQITDQNQNLRDMMREEWNLLMKGRPTNGWGGWDFDEEELLKMMEDVEADLMTEQELILREYERSCADEEAELCAVVDDYLSTRNDDVLCPVCTRTNLIKPAHNLIACRACGLRLDLDCDVISMTEVKERLRRAVETHANSAPLFGDSSGDDKCGFSLSFSVIKEQTANCQNLAACCANCDYFDIVI